MATLHGFSLKKVVNYAGHDGAPQAQGDVYYNGQRIGYFNTGDGGQDDLDFDHKYFDIMWKTAKEEDKAKPYYDKELHASMFLAELLELMDLEKTFKKIVKGGNVGMVTMSIEFFTNSYILKAPNMDIERYKNAIAKYFDEQYPNWTHFPKTFKVYTSLDQFTVG